MDAGVWKILDPTGMIEVEMRDNDMADVGWRETQLPNLRQRSFFRTQLRPVEAKEEVGQPFARLRHVLRPVPGIDQHQTRVRLDKRAMANQMCGNSAAVPVK